MNSFKGIKNDCDQIMIDLKAKLISKLEDPETRSEDLSICVQLALELGESAENMCDKYLATAQKSLDNAFASLDVQLMLLSKDDAPTVDRPSDAYQAPMDILEFVDLGCNTYVSDLCLVIAAYTETFLKNDTDNAESDMITHKQFVDEKMARAKLTTFVNGLNKRFFAILRNRLTMEKKTDDTALRVRALDRFHRRFQAMTRLLPTIDFARAALDLVLEASELHCELALEELKRDLQDGIMSARQALVAPKRITLSDGEAEVDLSELNTNLLTLIAERLKHQISHLQLFIDPELTFAVKTYFRAKFARIFVREKVLVAFFSHIIEVAQNYCYDGEKTTPPALLLLMSRTCFDLQLNTTQYLVSIVDEQFFIDDRSGLTTLGKINDAFKDVSQILLDSYVKAQGSVLSQMLRKSVETRDWLNTVEPRTVRAVMKRVVEETTVIDRQVGKLYEEGMRKARSSDSARTGFSKSNSRQARSTWSVNQSQLNTSLASNIIKMFNEKIEIFAPVEFSKVSILTGIVKIALKTLLECIRLRTFSRFGFQQIQVDSHYLHLYLWRFVSDENLVIFLLDEIMTSSAHRCLDPVPMESSVVEVICDRG